MTRVVSFHDHALLPDFGLSLSRSVYAGIPEEPEHSHDFLELVVVTHGSGIHNFNGEQFRLAAGNIFVIMPGVTHSYLNEDDLELYSFLFFDEFLEPFRSDLERISGYHLLFSLEPGMEIEKRMSGNLFIPPPILNQAHELCRTIRTEFLEQLPGCRVDILSDFLKILILLSRNCRARSEHSIHYHYAQEISKILSFMELNFRQEMSLDSLARSLNMSQSNFRRVFAEMTGISPIRYLLNLRLRKAAKLLQENRSDSIQKIAFLVGFQDSNYFSHQFRNFFGLSPLQYRKKP
ncbi:helix-turn-helix domain-containing protein [uncultured Victivallis sp.]|uniref:helix-turn-helix domain-containing protein n=1 Tax=uncultured Victivallis sp. TaxID=354118 RepID=UPI0025F84F4D|nr:helix-turn-helix domain-containing protein [uncultured Victivallis sp.]